MLRCHAFGLKNDRDVSFQPFQKKRTANSAPAQRAAQMAIPFASLHRCADEPTFAACCSQRGDTAVQHFGPVYARTLLVREGLEQVNRRRVAWSRNERHCCGFRWRRRRAGSAASYRFDSREQVCNADLGHQ